VRGTFVGESYLPYLEPGSTAGAGADSTEEKSMKGATLAAVILLVMGTTLAQRPFRGPDEKPLKMGQADANTFVGIVSDSSCGPRHKLSDKSAEECTRTCQRRGAHYVLVAGEKIYPLSGRASDLGYLAGQKAKITGSLRGGTIAVDSVFPAE
jgi:hypothetical protein